MRSNRNDPAGNGVGSRNNFKAAGLLAPSLRAPAACPDCSADYVDQILTHDETCPIGLAIDAICDVDQRWFEAHPEATEYRRPVTTAEVIEQRTAGVWPDVRGRVVGRVLVTQIAPGLRIRSFDGVLVVLIEPDGGSS